MSDSSFIRIRCKCGNEQILFSHAATIVKCSKCTEQLAHPSGGEAILIGETVETLG